MGSESIFQSQTSTSPRTIDSAPISSVLTLTEMAALLRIPKATMYKLAQLGRVPAFKVGKHWRFLRRDVEEWLAAHSAKAISVEVGER